MSGGNERGLKVTLASAVAALVVALAHVSSAQAVDDGTAKLTPVAIEALDRPSPVRAADGLHHLAYELRFANPPRG